MILMGNIYDTYEYSLTNLKCMLYQKPTVKEAITYCKTSSENETSPTLVVSGLHLADPANTFGSFASSG